MCNTLDIIMRVQLLYYTLMINRTRALFIELQLQVCITALLEYAHKNYIRMYLQYYHKR